MRTIINLNLVKMTFADIEKLVDYVWKDNLLIPTELIEGK